MLEIRHVTDTSSLKKAYDDIYNNNGIIHTDSFYLWILDLLQPRPTSRLLDIACGQGRLSLLATKKGVQAYGIDLSSQAVRIGHNHGAKLAIANGECVPFADSTFDYVTSIGSLEHYLDLKVGIYEITRVLKPQGLACILLPNSFSLLANVLFAWHTGRTADDGQPIQRFAARYEWQDQLEANGLKVIRTVKYECERPRSVNDLWHYMKYPKSFFRLLLTPLIPTNLANSFVYLCTRR